MFPYRYRFLYRFYMVILHYFVGRVEAVAKPDRCYMRFGVGLDPYD